MKKAGAFFANDKENNYTIFRCIVSHREPIITNSCLGSEEEWSEFANTDQSVDPFKIESGGEKKSSLCMRILAIEFGLFLDVIIHYLDVWFQ